jgi:L-ascorbate metabolism protein UlaG (beta-lactamase superfamily)
MRVRWLGWAGIEVESDGARLVVDPLGEPSATFAALGERARAGEIPEVVQPESRGDAVAALVTHLHRDHADAGALAVALAPEAAVHEPAPFGGGGSENLGLAQAEAELTGAGLRRRAIATWERVQAGPFTCTALPAVDGLGDPQVSWLIESGGHRVLHLGDTAYHGYWWRMAERHGPFDVVFAPINGAVVSFPHRQPPSPVEAVLTPEQAALAGELLGARVVVPMHYDGYRLEPWYEPVADAGPAFLAAAAQRPYEARPLRAGEELSLG